MTQDASESRGTTTIAEELVQARKNLKSCVDELVKDGVSVYALDKVAHAKGVVLALDIMSTHRDPDQLLESAISWREDSVRQSTFVGSGAILHAGSISVYDRILSGDLTC